MRSSLRLATTFFLAVGFAMAGSEGDPAHETPMASRSIKTAIGSVDAISGDLTLRVPLGPRLPGRIPVGFTWSFDNQDSLQSGATATSMVAFVGGSFRPVVWPSPGNFGDSPIQSTVMVDGRPLVFYRNYSTTKMPSLGDFGKAMTDRHVLPSPPSLPPPGLILDDPGSLQITSAIPSSDGTKFLVAFSYLSTVEHLDKNGNSVIQMMSLAPGYVVLDGANAIWAQFGNGASPTGHTVTHFTNLWGDHVTVDETALPVAPDFCVISKIEIKDLLAPGNTLTLAVSQTGTPWTLRKTGTNQQTSLPYDYPSFYGVTASINVTNTLGLPSASMPGYLRSYQRFWPQPASICPGYNPLAGPVAEGVWDDGFFPTQITQTAADQSSQSIAITWTQNAGQAFGAQTLGNPTEIDYPSGLKETFHYGQVVRLSQYSFSPCDGTWRGFQYLSGIPDSGGSTDNPLVGSSGITQVTRQDTRYPGVADETFTILRTQPTWVGTPSGQNQTTWTCTVHDSVTAILHYPTASPDASSPFRAIRLTHPSYIEGMDVAGPQGYLLATGAVLFGEALTGTGVPTSPSSLGSSPYAVTAYDGFDFRCWANPSGALTSGLPVTAVALRTSIYSQNLPTRITVVGNPTASGARDDYGPTTTDEYTDVPLGFPTVSGTAMPVIGSGLPSSENHPLHRQGKITREPDFKQTDPLNSLMRLVVRTDQKALSGSSLSSLRYAVPNPSGAAPPTSGISSADFGTTTFDYDSLGRIIKQQGDRTGDGGSYSAVEHRTYLGNTPLLAETTKDSLTGPGGPYYPNPDRTDVVEGKTYTWLPDSHLQAGPSSVTDKVDRRTESFTYDPNLGWVKSHTDVLGVVTTTDYDAWGRVSTVTRQAKGAVGTTSTTTTYDTNGQWKDETVSADGQSIRTHTDYDGFGRVVKVTVYGNDQLQANQQTFVYDGFGQKTQQSPVLTKTQTNWGMEHWYYDDRGRLTDHIDSQSRTLMHVVQQPGWGAGPGAASGITAVWTVLQDDQGAARAEGTDLLGQKVAVLDQAGQLSRYFYDKDGHLLQTLQGGQQRSYTYNAMGWLTSRTEPEEGTTSYSRFTSNGVPLTMVQHGRSGSAARNTFTTVLDAWLQPSTVTAAGPEGTITRNLTYDYQALNTHLLTQTQETQPNGALTETYHYDDIGRINKKTVTDGIQTFTVLRTLDASGRVLTLTYPVGSGRSDMATYSYSDPLGRMASVTMNNESVPRGSMLYDQVSASAVSQTLTLGNNAWTTSKIDRGELTRVTHVAPSGVLEDDAVSWTPGGLMLSRGQDNFGYDALKRLTSAHVTNPKTGTSVDQSFAYDRYGNRVTSTTSAPAGTLASDSEALTWTASYGNGNDLPTSVSGAGGSLSTGVVYDDLGRMTQVWTTPGQASTQTTWNYDPSGRVVKENGTSYLLDAQGLRFRRKKSDGSINYTIYGFNREPLVVWEQAAPVGVIQTMAVATTTKSTKKTSSKAGTVSPSIVITEPAGAYITQPSGPITVGTGVPVSFVGTTDFGTSFVWTFGDGATASTLSASHAFATAGSYAVTFKASASGYKTSTVGVTITVIAKPSIASFSASPTSITLGQSSTLSWSVSGATSLSISGVGAVSGTSVAVTPSVTTTYTLTATNAAGSVTASTTITLVPPVISAFSASPSSLTLGGTTTLSWNVAGAASLSISGIGAVSGNSVVVTPSASTTYTLTATNASGSVTASVTVTVNNPPPPTITSFGASATPINLGSSSTLSWSVSGATSLSINQGIGSVSGGSLVVTPTVTTTYTLTASNAWGTATRSVTITVLPPTISTFTASPPGITLGQGSTLAWSTSYATSVSISSVGAVSATGSTVVTPTTTTTYTLTATSSAGTTTAQVTVALAAPVINSLSATYTQITSGSGTTLVWNVTGAATLSLSPSPGAVSGNNVTVFPTATTVYTLTATNAAGSVTRNITITVDGAPVLHWSKTLVYGFGQLLCEEHASGPALIYVQSDQVGSPNWITDASGNQINYTKNLPFGERLVDTSPSASQSIRRFTNHEEDTDSNAIYMQAREYLAAYGKFAQVDPAYDQTKDDPESWNLYNYVTNNPVTNTDPDGRTYYGEDMAAAQGHILAMQGFSFDGTDPGFRGGYTISGGSAALAWRDIAQNSSASSSGDSYMVVPGAQSGGQDQKQADAPSAQTVQKRQSDTTGLPVLKEWAGETTAVAATVMTNIWDSKGPLFGLLGDGVGHAEVVYMDHATGIPVTLLSQFPEKHAAVAPNIPLSIASTKSEEGRKPDHSFMVDIKDRGAFAREALAERSKGNWTPMGIFGTQCTVSTSKALFAGGSSTMDRSPFRWPASLGRRLETLANIPGSGVTRSDPAMVSAIFGGQ